jgi:hypothetical protein
MAGMFPDFVVPSPPGVTGSVEQPFPPEFAPPPPMPYEVDGLAPPMDAAFAPPAQGFAPPVDPALAGAPQTVQPLPQESPPAYEPPPAPGQPVPFDSEIAGPPAGVPSYTPPQAAGATAPINEAMREPEQPESVVEQLYGLKATAQDIQARGDLKAEQKYRQSLETRRLKDARDAEIANKAAGRVEEAWRDVQNTKIDDRKLWNDMSGVAKAGAVIGAMIGGFLQARQGGQNQFLAVYQQMVKENIAAQRDNLATKKDYAQSLDTAYARMLNRFGDARTAELMTEAAMYNAGKNEALAKASMMKSEITRKEGVMAAQQMDAAARQALAEAQQQQFENSVKIAEFEEKQAHNAYTAKTGRISAYETARHNKASEANQAAELAIKKQEAEFKSGGKAFPIRGASGNIIGYADDSVSATSARKTVDNMARGHALYKEGRELFKNGRADNPASDLYRKQREFDARWVNFTKSADGDFSAPNASDFESRGLFGTIGTMNPQAALESGYRNSVVQNAAALSPYVGKETLIAEGFAIPEEKNEAKGNRQGSTVTPIVYQDDNGTINREGRGTPLSPEESKAIIERDEKTKRPKNMADWQYQRSQNNIAARSGRPLPFPDAGTGTID